MAINEQWLPIISEGIKWVGNKFSKLGPSKKELYMKVSDLEQQVRVLTAGNVALTSSLDLIIQAILNRLESSNDFTINAETICFVGENSGSINTGNSFTVSETSFEDINQIEGMDERFDVSKIFNGVDEEIAHTKIARSSDRK